MQQFNLILPEYARLFWVKLCMNEWVSHFVLSQFSSLFQHLGKQLICYLWEWDEKIKINLNPNSWPVYSHAGSSVRRCFELNVCMHLHANTICAGSVKTEEERVWLPMTLHPKCLDVTFELVIPQFVVLSGMSAQLTHFLPLILIGWTNTPDKVAAFFLLLLWTVSLN